MWTLHTSSSRSSMRRALALSLLCALAFGAGELWAQARAGDAGATQPANAQSSEAELERAREFYAEGSRLYGQGDYRGAIDSFEQAFAIFEAPELLFNLAQSHRKLGPEHCGPARDYYERYLRARPDSPDREEVLEKIANMHLCANEFEQARSTATTSSEPDPSPAPAAPAPAAPAPAASHPGSVADSSQTAAGMPASVYILAGVGVLGLASFATLGLMGKSDQEKLEQTCSPRCNPSEVDGMKAKFFIADVALGVGLVTLGSAAYLAFVPSPADQVAALPSGGQLRLSGQF